MVLATLIFFCNAFFVSLKKFFFLKYALQKLSKLRLLCIIFHIVKKNFKKLIMCWLGKVAANNELDKLNLFNLIVYYSLQMFKIWSSNRQVCIKLLATSFELIVGKNCSYSKFRVKIKQLIKEVSLEPDNPFMYVSGRNFAVQTLQALLSF